MLQLFADLGLRTDRRFEGTEVRCTIVLDQSDTYLTAVEERGRAADVASQRLPQRVVHRAVVDPALSMRTAGPRLMRRSLGAIHDGEASSP